MTLCHPDTFAWLDPQPAANSPRLVGAVSVDFVAYAGLDQEGALAYLDDQNQAYCTYDAVDQYGVRFLSVDAWPAMQQSYVEDAPQCGACDPAPQAQRIALARFYVAAGSVVVVASATADAATDGPLQVVFDIAETLRVDTGDARGDTPAALANLSASDVANCR